jgi:hypothetical protein
MSPPNKKDCFLMRILKDSLTRAALLCFLIIGGFAFLSHEDTRNREKTRKLMLDGGCIATAVLKYRREHEGRLPLSLKGLEYSKPDVDISAFKLVPPGTHSAEHPEREIILEAIPHLIDNFIVRVDSTGTPVLEHGGLLSPTASPSVSR